MAIARPIPEVAQQARENPIPIDTDYTKCMHAHGCRVIRVILKNVGEEHVLVLPGHQDATVTFSEVARELPKRAWQTLRAQDAEATYKCADFITNAQ